MKSDSGTHRELPMDAMFGRRSAHKGGDLIEEKIAPFIAMLTVDMRSQCIGAPVVHSTELMDGPCINTRRVLVSHPPMPYSVRSNHSHPHGRGKRQDVRAVRREPRS